MAVAVATTTALAATRNAGNIQRAFLLEAYVTANDDHDVC